MSYFDKELACRDCGAGFTFTAGQQEFFASKGFDNEPSRCKDCQSAKKAAQGDFFSHANAMVLPGPCPAVLGFCDR